MADERWKADLKVTARRWFTKAWQVVATDPAASDEADVEAAGATELAKQAGRLKGGMAKVAQLMAYAAGPGSVEDAAARGLLGALWDKAPARSAAEIGAVVAAELGGPPEQVFAAWNKVPLAAASLGQVHEARGHDGRDYAVKVQYPGVAEALKSDLASAGFTRRLAGSDLGKSLPGEAVEALREAILGEVDYGAEAAAIERFGAAFAGAAGIRVPSVNRTLSTGRVLTMERLQGRTLAEIARPEVDAGLRRQVAEAIFRFHWEGPLRHGILHADPNPGNYLISERAGEVEVAFLDYGCTTELDPEVVKQDREIWRGITHHDAFAGAEQFRMALQATGLLRKARAIDTPAHRDWEREVARPFAESDRKGPFAWTPDYAAALAEATRRATLAEGLGLGAPHLLLWRQRLGVAAVLGSLDIAADFRGMLREILRLADLGDGGDFAAGLD
jgi:predicted unusual protein kinase regulating ubiquinone biosynthesis (AarF/ABC1/UbiB family)